jgi:hypothetical protein
MANNDAPTNDKAAKAAAAGKATDNTKAEAADKAADTAGAGQAGAAANVPSTEASKGAPGEAAQPSAQGVTQGAAQENTKRRLVAIEVISRVDGFWRGGRQWTIAPQTVPLSELSDAQLLQITEEPLLIVRDVYEGER